MQINFLFSICPVETLTSFYFPRQSFLKVITSLYIKCFQKFCVLILTVDKSEQSFGLKCILFHVSCFRRDQEGGYRVSLSCLLLPEGPTGRIRGASFMSLISKVSLKVVLIQTWIVNRCHHRKNTKLIYTQDCIRDLGKIFFERLWSDPKTDFVSNIQFEPDPENTI